MQVFYDEHVDVRIDGEKLRANEHDESQAHEQNAGTESDIWSKACVLPSLALRLCYSMFGRTLNLV